MNEKLESEEKRALERQALLDLQGVKPKKPRNKKKRNRQAERRNEEKSRRNLQQEEPEHEAKVEQTKEIPQMYQQFLRFITI